MEIEEAIKMAIEHEEKVFGVYTQAVKTANSDIGKRVFKTLADEEQNHVNYLKARLEQWQNTGQMKVEKLKTIIPSKKVIDENIKKLKGHMRDHNHGSELQMLWKALDVEIETNRFYKKMVDQIEGKYQEMFTRFLEIEEGHLALVQAEIDAITGMGFWFDFREFDLEAN
ncbi:MAG: hypothetical protein B6D58_09000 [candidate division Zixibacteria bacterium 4484_95]|nr:MAG: hypothetical protein B6D58_09000 [candidate division Zixibacteria bacterium 4484_95]